MGQTVGYMPNTREGLLEEKDRVLYWSGEVLSKVSDNVNQEDSLLNDFNNESIDMKIDSWMESNQKKIDKFFSTHPDLPDAYMAATTYKLAQIREEIRLKMRNGYRSSYLDMRKFTKKVDRLGIRQRKIHWQIQNLEIVYDWDVEKFRTKFGPLRLKTFKNLRIGEKMMFQDQRLQKRFIKQTNHIDQKYKAECTKYVDKWIKIMQKSCSRL